MLIPNTTPTTTLSTKAVPSNMNVLGSLARSSIEDRLG